MLSSGQRGEEEAYRRDLIALYEPYANSQTLVEEAMREFFVPVLHGFFVH